MARFKVKDLMIQLAEDKDVEPGPVGPVGPVFFNPVVQCAAYHSGYWVAVCDNSRPVVFCGGTIREITVDWLTPVISPVVEQPVELEMVQSQLRRMLGQVEAQIRVRDEQLAPKTVEEVEQLEQRVTAVLADLRERKAQLSK